jgi:hypothetical protein
VGRDKGKQGIVNFIIKERNWCFVEGRHCVSIHKLINGDLGVLWYLMPHSTIFQLYHGSHFCWWMLEVRK